MKIIAILIILLIIAILKGLANKNIIIEKLHLYMNKKNTPYGPAGMINNGTRNEDKYYTGAPLGTGPSRNQDYLFADVQRNKDYSTKSILAIMKNEMM